MPEIVPPVPDPSVKPKPSDAMAREGEREGEVLVERDHGQSAPSDPEDTTPDAPTPATNGD